MFASRFVNPISYFRVYILYCIPPYMKIMLEWQVNAVRKQFKAFKFDFFPWNSISVEEFVSIYNIKVSIQCNIKISKVD